MSTVCPLFPSALTRCRSSRETQASWCRASCSIRATPICPETIPNTAANGSGRRMWSSTTQEMKASTRRQDCARTEGLSPAAPSRKDSKSMPARNTGRKTSPSRFLRRPTSASSNIWFSDHSTTPAPPPACKTGCRTASPPRSIWGSPPPALWHFSSTASIGESTSLRRKPTSAT